MVLKKIYKKIKKSIKFIASILLLLVVFLTFITISQVNSQLEYETENEEMYSKYVSKGLVTQTMNIQLKYEKILDKHTLEEMNQGVGNTHENNAERLLHMDSKINGLVIYSDAINVANVFGEISNMDDVVHISREMIKNNTSNIRYIKNDDKLNVVITLPIEMDDNEVWYSSIVVNGDELINKFENNEYRLNIINDGNELIYIENNKDITVLNDLIELYGVNFFNISDEANKNKTEIQVGDVNYYKGNLLLASAISDETTLVITKNYNKFYTIYRNNLVLTLLLFVCVIIGIIIIINYATSNTDEWIKNEKQVLNSLIESDKMYIVQLKRESEFYNELIMESANPIVVIDRDTNKVFMHNKSASDFYHYGDTGMNGFDFEKICDLDFVVDQEDGFSKVTHKKADNTSEEKRVKFNEFEYSGDILVVMNILAENDIDMDANIDKTDLFHEIRSPLQGAFSANSMIEKATHNYGEYTSIIRRSLSNVLEITNNVLANGKLRFGSEEIQTTEFDLVLFANEVISTVVFQDLNFNKISCAVSLNDNNLLKELDYYTVKTDKVKLRHILINLLSNASKYTKNGLISLVIDVQKLGDEDVITFKVSDTGRGITEKEIESIFEKYSTVGKNEINVSRYGLGLNVAKKYTELLGSNLDIHSQYGIGSVFSFELKFESCDIETKLVGSKSILIVDDDEVSCEFLKHFFKKIMKYSIKTISNEAHIFDELNHVEYDCVIIDQHLNHFNGLDIIELIRKSINERIANIPIVLMSATSGLDIDTDLGISSVISKPFNNDDIKTVVEKVFVRKNDMDRKLTVCNEINEEIINKNQISETLTYIDNVVFCEMVSKFINNSLSYTYELDKMITEDTYNNVQILTHRLKGSILYFAPVECKNLILNLEELARLEELREYERTFRAFQSAHQRLISELKSMCKKLNA